MANRFMPPTYFAVLLLFSIGSHFTFPLLKFIFPPWNYIGMLVILFGIMLNLWTDSLFKNNKTTVKPHQMPAHFIDFGPFILSRHPMYLGMMSILLGTAIMLGSIITFAFPILFVLIMEKMFIPMEEKNLEKKFGSKYLNYKRRVRRWI
jgi:protein-S-isoprenylcysteine O-methyltransferase Ste14